MTTSKIKMVVSIFIPLLLTACSYATIGELPPSTVTGTGVGPKHIDVKWMASHHEQIVSDAVKFIRERHPETASNFPEIIITDIEWPNEDVEFDHAAASNELRDIMHDVIVKLLGDRHGVEQWKVKLRIENIKTEMSSAAAILMIPTMLVCYKTIFMICPGMASSDDIILQGELTMPDGTTVAIAGAGQSNLYMSTLVLGDNPDPDINGMSAMHTNALVASMASLADSIVRVYERLYEAHLQTTKGK